ncbi:MAG: very short patch repair endonuclease [Verrucomicrobiia bacterium]
MTDVLSKQKRSQVMGAVHATGNRDTELRLVAILRKHRITGWRRHLNLPGKPDFAFPTVRLAVFVDGCFWHGCRWHCRMPKSRQSFWRPKLARNKARDGEVGRLLRKRGWLVLRFWEHSLRESEKVAGKIEATLAYRAPRR